jgi:uncharacterized DUF497 family protein
VHIEFDAAKNQANVASRNLSFKASRFDFATAVIDQDTRKNYPETLWVAIGYLDDRLHALCFTPVAGGIRVISFRKANAREVKAHDKKTRTVGG